MRSVSEISKDIRENDAKYDVRREELRSQLVDAQKRVRFECDACHRAVKVGEATVIQELEFRCPGQTGGYFVNAGRRLKCPHCGGTTNPSNQPEVAAFPNGIFAGIEEVELP